MPTLFGLAALVALVVGVAVLMSPGEDHSGAAGGTAAPPGTGVPVVTTIPSPLPEGCRTITVTPPSASDEYQGDLCLPVGLARDTAIVLVHGGGGYGGERSDMRPWAEVYRDAGYITLSVDYLIFDETTRSPVYPEPEQDVKAAVQYLRGHADDLGLTINQIVVHGSSAGARLGGQLYVTGDDPYYYDGEMWPSIPDHIDGFIGFYGYYSGMSADEERYYGGTEDSADPLVRGRWQRADSTANADGATSPALLIHGADDGVIDVEQTEEFAAALDAAGADVTTRILPGTDHAFDFDFDNPGHLTPEGEQMATVVLDWLDHHVG